MRTFKYNVGGIASDELETVLRELCRQLPELNAVFQERDLLKYENARLQEQLNVVR